MRNYYIGLGVDAPEYYHGVHTGIPKIGFAQAVESLGIMQRGKQDNDYTRRFVKTLFLTLLVMIGTAIVVYMLAKAR
jgi:hypothetical protein